MAANETSSVVVINHHEASMKIRTTTTTRAVPDRAATMVSLGGAIPSAATRTSTKTHTSVSVKSEPITFTLDPGVMARRVAEVFARRIREQTEQIAELAEPATIRARRKLERAFYRGEEWAWRQFDGGRMGVTPPRATADRKYNHSGRLAKGIVASYVTKTEEWKINFAANRWNPSMWSDVGKMEVAFRGWVARVPVLGNPSADLPIRQAFRDTWKDVVEKQRMGADRKAAMQKGQARLKAMRFLQGGVTTDIGDDENEEEAAS